MFANVNSTGINRLCFSYLLLIQVRKPNISARAALPRASQAESEKLLEQMITAVRETLHHTQLDIFSQHECQLLEAKSLGYLVD